MMFAAFFARVKPVSTSAKPACMAKTRTPPRSVQTMFRFVWTASAVGAASSAHAPLPTPSASNPHKTSFFIL